MFKYFEESQLIKLSRENGRGNGLIVETLKTFLVSFLIILVVGMMFTPTLVIIVSQESISETSMSLLSLFINVFYIAAVCWFVKKAQKRTLQSIGFVNTNAFNEYIRGLIIGFIMFVAVMLISWIIGAFQFSGFDNSFNFGLWVLCFIGFMMQGMAEEVICRGFIMTSMARKNSVLSGIIVNSIIFGLLHFANDGFSILAMINIIGFGAFMSLYMLKSGNIWGVGAIHTIWNFTQGCIFGLPVSGSQMPSIFKFEASGPDILSGGAFGPEGGIVVLGILISAIIMFIVKFKIPEENIVENVKKDTTIEKMKANNSTKKIINGEEREVIERCLDKPASSKKSK